jgi:hypothetical protein
MNCSTREAIKASAEWLMGVYMGSKIRITMARTEEELSENRKSNNVADMMADLESIIGGTPEPDICGTSAIKPDCINIDHKRISAKRNVESQ